MTIPPSEYGPESIRKLRMPDIEGAEGDWISTWQLRLRTEAPPGRLQTVAARVAQSCGEAIDLVPLEGRDIRLVLRSTVHPLDVDAYPLIDCILMSVDEGLRGMKRSMTHLAIGGVPFGISGKPEGRLPRSAAPPFFYPGIGPWLS